MSFLLAVLKEAFKRSTFIAKFSKKCAYYYFTIILLQYRYTAMYKTRNTGTRKRMRGTLGMGGCYIPGNVAKHSGECPQTFRGMSSNIPGNDTKHSGECPQTFRGMSSNIPGNLVKHSAEYRQTFWGMSWYIPGNAADIPGNVVKHSGECPQAFREMSSNIPGNVAKQKNFFFEADTFTKHQIFPEVYSEPLQISKMDCFA